MRRLTVLFGLLAAAAAAQAPPRIVRASGEATVSVRPDLAKVTIGVVTQAKTAQEAGAQNASQTDATLAAVRQVLGVNADIQTVNYSLTPNYQYPKPGESGPPTLIGYTANNSVQVTSLPDPALIGKVIDAATQSGANSVGGLTFTLKDPEPVRGQALTQAAKQARDHAQAIATGLGVTLGLVMRAEEGTAVRAVVMGAAAGGAPTTPIETGLVQVSATVTVDILIS